MRHFSRITLRGDLPLSELARSCPASPYEDHRLLCRLLKGPGDRASPRPLLFRRADHGGQLRYFVVSTRPPRQEDSAFVVETKPYDPHVAAGERLGFSLRLNPVVSRRDDHGRLHRHDLVMDSKSKLAREGVPRGEWPPAQELWRQAALAWLRQRVDRHGFAADEERLVVEAYHLVRFVKRGAGLVRFSALDLAGLLVVADPEQLRRVLFEGVGPAKGFGCGLLLVRRV